jgi:hypothetical protein
MERRRAPRYRVKGEASWNLDGVQGRCRVLNLSVQGMGVSDLEPDLRSGTTLEVALELEGRLFPGVRVRFVHSARGLGLAFVDPDAALIEQIEDLTDDLTPLAWAYPLLGTLRNPR